MAITERGLAEQLAERLERERSIRRQAESIAEDATRRLYDLSAALERSRAELEAVNRVQRDFIAIASHELQTPATPIIGFAQTLVQRWSEMSEEQRLECVQAIDRQAQRMGRLLSTLLTMSRLEAGRLRAFPERISIGECIEQAITLIGDEAREVEVSYPSSLHVHADPQQLVQILANYVSNAIKYGGPPVRVEAVEQSPWVAVRVLDGGRVSPEFTGRLFERFSQADVDRAPSGTGLGLYIARGLARAQNGDVWYEPLPGGGSCFGVLLPAEEG